MKKSTSTSTEQYKGTTLGNIPNHLFFMEFLKKSINHAKRHKQVLAILLIEFKAEITANDAEQLSSVLRTDDVLATYNDHTFLVLLNNIAQPKFVGIVAEKMGQIFSNTPLHIGIGIYPADGETEETLFRTATETKKMAQHASPTAFAYQLLSPELDRETREHHQLSHALKSSLEKNELKLFYQPKMHLKHGSTAGVEALIRWEHPTLGLIDTGKMIKLAEESGLIASLGEWAIQEACKVNKHWQTKGYEHLTVGVNVSPKQFYDKHFIEKLTAVLNNTGLHPEFLELEINEETVMGNMDEALAILEKISALGVKITLDHFGVGYTSISHLKSFPINHLKIDHSFIKGLPQTPNDIAIVKAFIDLSHHLGFEIIAEGVENAEQMQFLSTQGCDIVQGYFLGSPLPADEIQEKLRKITDEVLI